MTLYRLLLRNLRHFWRADLATLAGMAVATAVLVGALLVGDSVRGSLQELAVRRLGPVDYAMASPRPVPVPVGGGQSLSFPIFYGPQIHQFIDKAVDGLIVNGGAMATGTGSIALSQTEDEPATSTPPRTAGGVQIIGLSDWQKVTSGECVLNGRLADDLGVRVGDEVDLNFPRISAMPLDSSLARRGRNDVLGHIRKLRVARIDRGGGMADLFSLTPTQRPPRNAWVNLEQLQHALDLWYKGNLTLVSRKRSPEPWRKVDWIAEIKRVFMGKAPAQDETDTLNAMLKSGLGLRDYGLSLEYVDPDKGWRRPGMSSVPRWSPVPTIRSDEQTLQSDNTYLPSPVVAAARRAAASLKLPIREVTVNLAGTVESSPEPRAGARGPAASTSAPASPRSRLDLPATQPAGVIHYAIVAGVSGLLDDHLRQISIQDGHIVLNDWAAKQLGVESGGRIRFTFYRRDADGRVRETWSDGSPVIPLPLGEGRVRVAVGKTDAPSPLPLSQGERGKAEFKESAKSPEPAEHPGSFIVDVNRTLPMDGLGGDRTFTPSFAGLTDQARIADWHPPTDIKIDKRLITQDDEAYWKEYRAAPKLFINLETARRLWGDQPGGFLTSIRVTVPGSQPDAFKDELLRQINPADLGMAFQPVRDQQLAAAGGTTDFAQLFMGFSFFLIASAVLLVALLFRLGIERRARQIGLLGAIGFSRRRIMGLLLAEGGVLALIGGVIGSAGGVGYCWLMMAGLRTWWFEAVGTTALRLSVSPMSLATGLGASVLVALLAVLWGVWRVGRTSAAALLAGGTGRGGSPQITQITRIDKKKAGEFEIRKAAKSAESVGKSDGGLRLGLFAAGTTLAAIAFFTLPAAGAIREQHGFLAGGSMLLATALLLLARRWRSAVVRSHYLIGPAALALAGLGVRNAARHPGRSVLTVALLASASFVLVIVGAMRQGRPAGLESRRSGAGGFSLLLTADVPLTGDLNTPAGRKQVGIRTADDPLWTAATFVQLRRRPGQDASCLNMTRPGRPTILGVPQSMIARGGFTFDSTVTRLDNPWTLLNAAPPKPADPIPMIADAATANYSLHLGLGQTMTVQDDSGQPVQLRLVATLANSIFQSEVLIGEQNFRRLFPGQGGFGLVLVRAPAPDRAELSDRLRGDLAEMAVTVEPSADRLAAYAGVANTYLATFQSLGALGLLLGTVGLAVVLIRSLIERRGELALLAAIGFTPHRRLLLVLAENAFLLVLGIAIGAGSAVLGVLPGVATGEHPLNVPALLLTLGGITVFGLAALVTAAVVGGRRFSVADLHAE